MPDRGLSSLHGKQAAELTGEVERGRRRHGRKSNYETRTSEKEGGATWPEKKSAHALEAARSLSKQASVKGSKAQTEKFRKGMAGE